MDNALYNRMQQILRQRAYMGAGNDDEDDDEYTKFPYKFWEIFRAKLPDAIASSPGGVLSANQVREGVTEEFMMSPDTYAYGFYFKGNPVTVYGSPVTKSTIGDVIYTSTGYPADFDLTEDYFREFPTARRTQAARQHTTQKIFGGRRKPKRKKRKLSEWNKLVKKLRPKGYSMSQISACYRGCN